MSQNLLVNGDLKAPDWEGWEVNTDRVERIENNDQVFAKLSPVSGEGAVFQQVVPIKAGQRVKISFQHSAWIQDGDTSDVRLVIYALVASGPEGLNGVSFFEPCDKSFRYCSEEWVVPDFGETMFLRFGVTTMPVNSDNRLLPLTLIPGVTLPHESQDPSSGPILLGNFLLEVV